MEQKYDSTENTKKHIKRVQELLLDITLNLNRRAAVHDKSKLEEPEKSCFDEYTPLLKGMTYGSSEYKECLEKMNKGLEHHYSKNSHHPQFWKEGINGMSLLDLVEMFCDWRAATERHENGNLTKSIEINKERFLISDQLAAIFRNTQKEMGW